MTRKAVFGVFFCLALLHAAADDEKEEWKKAQREYSEGIASSDPAKRVAALKALRKCDDPSSAKALLSYLGRFSLARADKEVGLSRAARSVHTLESTLRYRVAVLSTLSAFRKPETIEFLLGRQGVGNDNWEVSSACLYVLGRVRRTVSAGGRLSPPVPDDLYRRVRDAIRSGIESGDPRVRMDAAFAMKMLSDAENLPQVHGALLDPSWQVRLAAIEACARIGEKASVSELIDALQREDGRLQEDIMKALGGMTGVDVPPNPAAWKSWWDWAKGRGKEEWRQMEDATRPTFYGVRFFSKRVMFVLDVTGSMHVVHLPSDVEKYLAGQGTSGRPPYKGDTMLDLAKYELIQAIAEMPEDTFFDVITFESNGIRVWEDELRPATEVHKKKAAQWIRTCSPNGDTNLYDGLRRSFEFISKGDGIKNFVGGPDTILLFTDGYANAGRLVDSSEILRAVEGLYLLRRIRIDTIGLGRFDDDLLRSIARRTQGTFRKVSIGIDRERERTHSHGAGGG